MAKEKPEHRILTEDELMEQSERSMKLRQGLKQVIKDMAEGFQPEEIAIALSGGVDSVTTLWTMMDMGIRPHKVYTLSTPRGDRMSGDQRKAIALCEHYSLDQVFVDFPEDPELVSTTIEKLFAEHIDLLSSIRPDKEVPFAFDLIFQAAQNDGIKCLFSGLTESGAHKVNRRSSILGRQGLISHREITLGVLLADNQAAAIGKNAAKYGIHFMSPQIINNKMGGFYDVDWKLLNTPRDKALTMNAYAADIEETGVNPQALPLQSGDSGLRTYFDEMLEQSTHAQQVVGSTNSSSTKFGNALERKYRYDEVVERKTLYHDRTASRNAALEFNAYLETGAEFTERTQEYLRGFMDPETHEARLPEEIWPDDFGLHIEPETDDEDTNLFGDVFDAPVVDKDEVYDDLGVIPEKDGSLDRHVDCRGKPMWADFAARKCPMARAGLCTKFDPDIKRDLSQCEYFDDAVDEAYQDLVRYQTVLPQPARNQAYATWAKKVKEYNLGIKSNIS